MKEEKKQLYMVEYWVQDSIETGHWERTELIPRAIAEGLIFGDFGPSLERGILLDADGNILWGN